MTMVPGAPDDVPGGPGRQPGDGRPPGDGRGDDTLWSAVGDPTRRRMLDLLLSQGGGTATSLSVQLPVTRQAVAKHLMVLDRAGLVHGVTIGREKQYRIDSAQLARAVSQLAHVGATWDRRLRRIKDLAEAIEEKAREQVPDPTDK